MNGPPCTFKSNDRAPKPTPNMQGPSLRLIALENPKRLDKLSVSEGPLTVDRQIYGTITTRFEISPMFLAAALNQEAIFLKVGIASVINAASDSFEAAPSTV